MARTLTTTQAARVMGVSDQTVANWVDQGALRAGRTAGGHRRIEVEDVVAFLTKHQLRVPPELQRTGQIILVVDDEPAVCKWLADAIRKAFPQATVLTAEDGYSAGEIVTKERPDLVILDLYMPGMDGFEVCRKIKSGPDGRQTVVVAITAHPSPEARREILSAGAVTCLSKPVTAKRLQISLSKILPVVQHPAGAIAKRPQAINQGHHTMAPS